MLSQIKSYVKTKLLGHSPKIYTLLFQAYQRVKQFTGKEVSSDIFRVARFNEKGFYPFYLDEIKFDMYLNPLNGWVDSAIFLNGALEPNLLKLIRQNISGNDIFFDIGANIGQHGLYASRFCKSVFSFEPIERLYQQLNLSIDRNSFKNVKTFNIGLGNENGEFPIYSDTSNMGGSSVLNQKGKRQEQIIKIARLDDFILNNPAGVTMMKIDVEGFEWEVLMGGVHTMEKYKPKLLLEYSLPLYNQISPSRGEDIYTFLAKLYPTIYNVGLDLEIKKEVRSFEDLRTLKHHTNLWCVDE